MFGLGRNPNEKFWHWLAGHRRQISAAIGEPGSAASLYWCVDELGRRLRAVDAGIVHEIGLADPSTIELIVSADGIREVFPSVTALVRSAPPLEGFKITAFRPRCGDGLRLEVGGNTVTDDMLTYRLTSEGHALGAEVFVDCEIDEQALKMAGFLSLDQRLGEYDVATGLRWIEFARGRPAGALPIAGLARDFDARRGLQVH